MGRRPSLIFLLILAAGIGTATAARGDDPVWTLLSSDTGDLPSPGPGVQQTGCLVLDIDRDGRQDFVIAERTESPSVTWYRRTDSGWDRYVIENQVLPMDAGGDFTDIDGDGDLDISFGGGYDSNEIWWWANPAPEFHPDSTWTRRVIKNSGANKHHDQLFGDFDNDGRDELVFWNQLAGGKLMLAEIPADPLAAAAWEFAPIFTGSTDSEGLAAGDVDLDGRLDIVGAGFWLAFDGLGGFTAHEITPDMASSRCAVGQLIPGGRPEVIFCPGDGDGPLKLFTWDQEAWVESTLLDPVLHGHSLQIADVDRDGYLDIFCGEMHTPGAGDAARTILFYGDGTGAFSIGTVAVGTGIHEGRLADLDGDGDLDILDKPFTEGAPVVNIWLQEGAPEVQWNFDTLVLDPAPLPVPDGTAPDFKIADIDGDSWPDLWLPGSGGPEDQSQMHWYKGPYWDRFDMNPGNFGPGAWCDIDGDGDLDLAVCRPGADPAVLWLENTGTPAQSGWPEHIMAGALPAGGDEVIARDLDRDGRMDLIVNCGGLELGILKGPSDPTGPWSLTVVGSAGSIRSGLDCGDIDRDGDPDILWGNGWLENPDDFQLPWPDHTVASGWPAANRALLCDLNRDGRPDVVLAAADGPEGVAWFACPENPAFDYWSVTPVGSQGFSGFASLAAGDFDADGDVDIFAAEDRAGEDPDRMVLFDNSGGTASVWLETAGPITGAHRAAAADLDRDGDLDLAGTNRGGDGGAPVDLRLWENKLDTKLELDQWQRHVVDPARPWRAVFLTVGDINRDGLTDLVNGAWWYRNPGGADGDWARFELGLPLRNMAAVADFDRDGDLDVLGTQGIPWDPDPRFVWTRNDGAGGFTVLENIPDGSGSFLQGTAAATFTIDRALDFNPGEVALSWENGGGGIQMLTVPEDPSGQAWGWRNISSTTLFEGLDSGDIDRDGDQDLLLGNLWLRNDSPNWTTFTIEVTAEEPDRVILADLNRDGRLDALVGFEEWPAYLVWYEQPGDPTGPWPRHDIALLMGPMSLDVADMDKDGDLDIVVGEHNLPDQPSSALFVYENLQGGLAWQQHLVYFGDEHHMGAQLLDADNDGDLDIASFGWNTTEVLLYENLATPGGAGLPLGPAVTISPTGGQFSCPVALTLDSPSPSVVRFTLDGTTPSDVSPLYTVPVTVDTNVTVRARAFAAGTRPGPVAEGSFVFFPDQTPPRLMRVDPAGVPDRLVVTFSEPMDTLTSSDPANYVIDGGAVVLDARPRPGLDVVELVTSGLTPFLEHTLTVSGLADLGCPSHPLAPEQVATFTYVPWLRVTDSVVAIYYFDEGSGTAVRDRSGVAPLLDLFIADPAAVAWSAGRLDVISETIIASPGPAEKINDACRSSGELTLEAWITPADLTLNGPARILTVSGDQFGRNFTMGQGVYGEAGDQIDMRLTLSTTSTNGQPSLSSGAGTLAAALTHTVFTRDSAGMARLYLNGVLVAEEPREGVMSNWITSYPLSVANETGQPGDRYWLGGLHLAAVYDRALDGSEVLRNHEAGVPEPAVSAVETTPGHPFTLHANVPNPFNPVTAITFDLPTALRVDLAVFDLAGRRVCSLESGNLLTPGRHTRTWNGRDGAGRPVGAGVYFCRIVAGPHRMTRKMLLLK